MSGKHCGLMMLSDFYSEGACSKDTLPTNDQIPRTDTEHMGIAMLSEQLKISGGPSYISWQGHRLAGAKHHDRPSILRFFTFPLPHWHDE